MSSTRMVQNSNEEKHNSSYGHEKKCEQIK